MIPLHIGVHPPTHWDDIEVRQREHGEDAGRYLRDQRRPPVASTSVDWVALGFDPRWVGDDAAECVVAIEPGIYHDQGAEEFERFIRGAERRDELALVVTTLHDTTKVQTPLSRMFASADVSGSLSGWNCSIDGTMLGNGVRVQLAVSLRGADKDLALRLVNEELRWWTLELSGSQMYNPGTGEQRTYPAVGVIEPILETALGETVVGAWVSPDGRERRYILPADVEWTMVADWVAEQCIPEYNPAAIRRHRRMEQVPVELMTRAEELATLELDRFETETEERRTALISALALAREAADSMRHSLLYGRGDELVSAVAEVLRGAGVTVVVLDEELGGTKNADLLCSLGPRRRLVEVKSVGGAASESLYSALLRHLDTWGSFGRREEIDAGVLVLNHEHKREPGQRNRQPYTRPEFLASQQHPVVTSLDTFDAWRVDDFELVRSLFFGGVEDRPSPSVEAMKDSVAEANEVVPRSRWWRRGSPTGRKG